MFRIGSKEQATLENKIEDEEEEEEEVVVYEEGAEGDGVTVREILGIPSVPAQRQKHFLKEENRQKFEFEEGREYKCDFFNPYLDFNEFALKLGYGLPAISIVNYWDGQPLRYVSLFCCFVCAARGLTDKVLTLSDMYSRIGARIPSSSSSYSSLCPPRKRGWREHRAPRNYLSPCMVEKGKQMQRRMTRIWIRH